ncbi:MAG: HEAT repeat domain-containing protein, partial [Candidatus Aminicenantales bacterium]
KNLKGKKKSEFLLSTAKDKAVSSSVQATVVGNLNQSSFQTEAAPKEDVNLNSGILARTAKKALKELKQRQKENRRVSDLVLRKIKSTKEKQKRLKIIKSIAGVEGTWVNGVLVDALEDPSEEIRDFIIKELAQRENLKVDSLYQKLLRPPWYVKSAVLKLLGLKKDPLTLGLIEAVVNDPNADVRRSAARALGEIGGEEALLLLNKLAQDKNQFVRKSAEEGLNKASHLKFS